MNRIHRLAGVLAAAVFGVLAFAATAPAAFAMRVPPGPTGASPTTGLTNTIHVVTTGGMAGWQITLIALATALLTAAAAVRLDRARARRATPATSI